jgi:hypothetical protein
MSLHLREPPAGFDAIVLPTIVAAVSSGFGGWPENAV